MFTSLDKALAALVMAVMFVLNNFFGINLGIDETTVNTIIAAVTPFLVWLIPNKDTSTA